MLKNAEIEAEKVWKEILAKAEEAKIWSKKQKKTLKN